MYDVEKQAVEKVWYPGSLRTFVANDDQIWLEIRSSGSRETTFWTWPGNRKLQAEQQETSEFSVSPDRSWVLQQGKLSDGPYINLYQRQKGGDYLLTEATANSGSIMEKVSAAASFAHGFDTIQYGNINFEGWEAGTNQMQVGFSVKLEERGERGVFLRMGWKGIYDLDQKRVTKQMDPGSQFEPIQSQAIDPPRPRTGATRRGHGHFIYPLSSVNFHKGVQTRVDLFRRVEHAFGIKCYFDRPS